jgi:hypothetical protein
MANPTKSRKSAVPLEPTEVPTNQVPTPPVFNPQIEPEASVPTIEASEPTPVSTPENTTMSEIETPVVAIATFDVTTATDEQLQSALLQAKDSAAGLLTEITETHDRLNALVADREAEVAKVRDIRAELRRREDEADGIVPTRATTATPVQTSTPATSDRKPRGKVPTMDVVVEYLRTAPKQSYDDLATHFNISRSSVTSLIKAMKESNTIVITMDGSVSRFSAVSAPPAAN